jgi:hypothetical protein
MARIKRIVTANDYVRMTDEIIFVNSSSDVYLALPPSQGTMQEFIIKNIGTGKCYLYSNQLNKIDGENFELMYQYDTIELIDASMTEWITVRKIFARLEDRHDDMLGKLQSPQTGGTTWIVEDITGADFVVGALRNNSSDVVQVTIQVPHRRKLATILDSIHIHYNLQAASNLNETIVFTGRYAWVGVGETIPDTASWTSFTGAGLTLNLGAAKPARYYGIHSIQASIPPPATEGYGGMLLIHIARGNGTYAGNLGILDFDAHSIMSQLGSKNEATD